MTAPTHSIPQPLASSGGSALTTLAGRLIFGLLTLLLLAIVVLWQQFGEPIGRGFAAAVAALVFTLHLILARTRISAFDPVVWIPISMLLFYFGVPIAVEVINPGGDVSYDPWRVGIVPNLERGLTTALLGMTAYIWGVYLIGLKDLSGHPSTRAADRSLLIPALIFTLGSTAMVAGGIALVGPSVVFGYYNDWWAAKAAGADARWIDIGLVFMQAGVYALLASVGREQRLARYFAYAVSFAIIVMTVQKGARAQLVAFGIGAAWCYSQRIRRVRPSVAVGVAVAALLVMPVLKEWRHSRTVEATRSASVQELAAAAFRETGSSVYTIVYTMHLIPSTRSYAWGASYWDSTLHAIPNLGLTPGKFWGKIVLENHPSRWITFQLNPEWYFAGGGYGSSMVAELYFNFGIIGVALGATIFGILTALVRNSAQGSSMKLVASALFFGAMAIHVRNVIGVPIKMVAWPLIGLYLIRKTMEVLGGKPLPAPDHGPNADLARRESALGRRPDGAGPEFGA